MTGFVAGGAVALLYLGAMLWAGRRATRRGESKPPPPAWLVWLVACPVLVVGIPWITMSVNVPTMPPEIAAAIAASALVALGLALAPARWAAERPVELMWLAALGLGLEPVLTTWRAVELPARGILTERQAWGMMILGVGASLLWLSTVSRLWWRLGTSAQRMRGPGAEGGVSGSVRALPSSGAILLSGLTWHALGQPLAHHLLATPPGFRYITSAGNIFAESAWVWMGSVLMATAVTVVAIRSLPGLGALAHG